jgi:hypothetical protein
VSTAGWLTGWALSIGLAAAAGWGTAWAVGFARGMRWERQRQRAVWDGTERRRSGNRLTIDGVTGTVRELDWPPSGPGTHEGPASPEAGPARHP